MKHLRYILWSCWLLVQPSVLQAQFNIDPLVTEACACIEETYANSGTSPEQGLDIMKECLQTTVMAHQEELMEAIRASDTVTITDSTYEAGYDLGYRVGQELGRTFKPRLIKECNIFAQIIDSGRYQPYLHPDTTGVAASIAELHQQLALKPDHDSLHWTLGIEYLKLQQTDNAGKHFIRALELDSSKAQNWYFVGWVQELNQEYEQAYISYYECQQRAPQGLAAFMDIVCLLLERKISLAQPIGEE